MSLPPPAPSPPRLPPVVRSALLAALALVAPCDCAGCGAPDVELCATCRARLRAVPSRIALPDGTPLVSALVYEGVVRDVILAFKQSGRYRLAKPLGPALADALAEVQSLTVGRQRADDDEVLPPIAVLVVPPSRSGRRQRGYDPVDLLVRAAGAVSARPGLAILRPRFAGGTGPQKGLSRIERLRSREGTLRCPEFWSGRRVVLVDDVATSGATLVEAVRAAKAAGADVVAACCLAATPLVSAKVP